ncbi:MAG: SpoVG family protein [Lachnospiraceae bacterium]|nr:SpoVG family protein [Lachnospiraceae bacterium]
MMTVNAKVTPYENGKLKGLASVSFNDDVKLNGIRIMEGKEGKLFVSCPSFQTKEGGYVEYFHPITKEFKETFDKTILDAYQDALDGVKRTPKQAEGVMEISSVRATEFQKDNLRGLATVVLDDSFVIQNIKVMRGEHGLFPSMPSYKGTDGGFHEYVECGKGFKKELQQQVVEALVNNKSKAPEAKAPENTVSQEAKKPSKGKNVAKAKPSTDEGRQAPGKAVKAGFVALPEEAGKMPKPQPAIR